MPDREREPLGGRGRRPRYADVPLEYALKLVYLPAEKDSPECEKAAMRFLRRCLDEKEPTCVPELGDS